MGYLIELKYFNTYKKQRFSLWREDKDTVA